MSERILENNGIDNTNIDGAGFNRFCAGQRDGILKGLQNECQLSSTSNVLNMNTGVVLLSGIRVVVDDIKTFTFSSTPSIDTRYQLILQVVIDSNDNVTSTFVIQVVGGLIQENIFGHLHAGTYQVEIGRFTLTSGLIVEDVVRTLDIITGGVGGGSGNYIEIGEVTTIQGEIGTIAEVDIENVVVEGIEKTNFTFTIPEAYQKLYSGVGQNTDGSMSQKAVSDILVNKQDITQINTTTTSPITLVDNTSFRLGTITVLTINNASTYSLDFICEIVFIASSTISIDYSALTLKWSGDDVESNVFVPVASKTYNILFFNNATSVSSPSIQAIVRGVE